jgi:hypothetical protein
VTSFLYNDFDLKRHHFQNHQRTPEMEPADSITYSSLRVPSDIQRVTGAVAWVGFFDVTRDAR